MRFLLSVCLLLLLCVEHAQSKESYTEHMVCGITTFTDIDAARMAESPFVRALRVPHQLYAMSTLQPAQAEIVNRLARTVTFRGTRAQLLDVLSQYSSEIEHVEVQPTRRIEPIQAPQELAEDESEPLVELQYYIQQTGVPLDSKGNPQSVSSTVTIAVIDSGFDLDHIDLQGIWLTNAGEMGVDEFQRDKATNGIDDDNNGFVDDWRGWDFVSDSLVEGDNDPTNGNEHGTFVAGIIAAQVNDFGLCGVAPGVTILPLKVTEDHPFASDILAGYEAILYAADRGVDIINCSWGGVAKSELERDIISLVTSMNIHVVGAAGNEASYSPWYPGSYDAALNVAATDSFGYAAQFSNFHPSVDIAAPGADILSTFPFDGYKIRNGTSFAAPQVSGALARLVDRFPELSIEQRERVLLSNTQEFLSTGGIPVGLYGRGELQVTTTSSITEPYVEMLTPRIRPFKTAYRSGETFEMSWQVETAIPAEQQGLQHTRFTNTMLYDEFSTSAAVSTGNSIQAFPPSEIDARHGYNTTLYAEITMRNISETEPPLARSGLRMVVNPTYDQVTSGTWTLTVGSNGTLGYEDHPDNALGQGLTDGETGRSVLYEAGVVLTSPTATSDMVRGRVASRANRDFERLQPVEKDSSWYTEVRAQYACVEDTSFADATVQQWVRTYPTIPGCFVVSLTASTPDHSLHDSVSLGYFLDFDIGETGRLDSGFWDPHLGVAVLTDLEETLYVGVIPFNSSSTFLVNNDGSTSDDPGIFNGFRDEEKWFVFSHPESPTSTRVTDISVAVRSKPSKFGKNQPLTADFAIFVSESFDDLVANVSQIRSIVDVPERPLSSRLGQHRDRVLVSPHPLEEAAQVSWYSTTTQPSIVSMYDGNGNLVFQRQVSQSIGVHSVSVATGHLPVGVYTCVIEQGSSIKSVKVLRR